MPVNLDSKQARKFYAESIKSLIGGKIVDVFVRDRMTLAVVLPNENHVRFVVAGMDDENNGPGVLRIV